MLDLGLLIAPLLFGKELFPHISQHMFIWESKQSPSPLAASPLFTSAGPEDDPCCHKKHSGLHECNYLLSCEGCRQEQWSSASKWEDKVVDYILCPPSFLLPRQLVFIYRWVQILVLLLLKDTTERLGTKSCILAEDMSLSTKDLHHGTRSPWRWREHYARETWLQVLICCTFRKIISVSTLCGF